MACQRRVDWYRISGAGHLTMRTTVRPYNFAYVNRLAEHPEQRLKQPMISPAIDARASSTECTACSERLDTYRSVLHAKPSGRQTRN